MTTLGRLTVTLLIVLIAFVVSLFTGCKQLAMQERTYRVQAGFVNAEVNLKPAHGYRK